MLLHNKHPPVPQREVGAESVVWSQSVLKTVLRCAQTTLDDCKPEKWTIQKSAPMVVLAPKKYEYVVHFSMTLRMMLDTDRWSGESDIELCTTTRLK